MTIKYKYSLDDKLAYGEHISTQSPFYLEREKNRKWWSLGFYILAGIAIALVAYILNSLFILCMDITLMFFAFTGLKKHDPKMENIEFYRKYYASLPHYVADYDIELGISDSGLKCKDGMSEESFYFSSITGISSTPDHVFVNILGPKAFVVPVKKIYDGDLEAFLSELRSKTSTVQTGL